MSHKRSIKRDILLAIAKSCDFKSVRRKFPEASEGFIKNVLLEASKLVDDEGASTKPKTGAKMNGAMTMYTDGASKGNPGAAAAGIVIKDKNGNDIARIKKYLGTMTNNQAEYSALIIGLKAAKKFGGGKINILMDSELVVKQIKGEYKIKNAGLKELSATVIKLLKDFDKYSIKHILRSKNSQADALANEAIKAAVAAL